jgi:hypothetical protein
MGRRLSLGLLLCGCAKAFSAVPEGDALVVTATGPRTVTVQAPSSLTSLAHGRRSKWVGCGFTLDWGDGSGPAGDDCATWLTHVYAKAGTYTVSASTFHPNPDDSHTVDWRGSAKVEVR